jgi:phosphoglycolate phosphatase-like HAD superfamily hydrolase
MYKLITFDFDKTIIYLNDLHRDAWVELLQKVGLRGDMDRYLPPTPWRIERFDSEDRVKMHFFKNAEDAKIIKQHLKVDNQDQAAAALVALKEKRVLSAINNLSDQQLHDRLGEHLHDTLQELQKNGYSFGVISSAREAVITTVLKRTGLEKFFMFIIGEESMRDQQGILHDKPSTFALTKVPSSLLNNAHEQYYIGDDIRIDTAFARNCGFAFIQVDKTTDFRVLLPCIMQAQGQT